MCMKNDCPAKGMILAAGFLAIVCVGAVACVVAVVMA